MIVLKNDGGLFLFNLNRLEKIKTEITFDEVTNDEFGNLLLKSNDLFYQYTSDYSNDPLEVAKLSDLMANILKKSDEFCVHERIALVDSQGIKILQDQVWKNYLIPGESTKSVDHVAINQSNIAFTKGNRLIVFEESAYNLEDYKFEKDIQEIVYDINNNLWVVLDDKLAVIAATKTGVPEIILRSLSLNGELIQQDKMIHLTENQNELTLDFIVYGFLPSTYKFYYMINGYHDVWQQFNQPSMSMKLPAGNYELLTKVESSDNIEVKTHFKTRNGGSDVTDKWLVALLIFCGIILIILAFILLKSNGAKKLQQRNIDLLRKESSLLNAQLKAFQLQLNPHFLFNALNNIQGLIITDEHIKARNQLRSFSLLMRQVLKYSDENWIKVTEDIQFLERYLSLESMNHNNKFSYEIEVNNPDILELMIPPMITQIPVENAILHGLKHKDQDGKISITYSLEEEFLKCEIIDNGTGIEPGYEIKKASKGISIVNKRLSSANNAYVLENNYNKDTIVGSRATLRIPYKLDR